jgi:hypothetical protein
VSVLTGQKSNLSYSQEKPVHFAAFSFTHTERRSEVCPQNHVARAKSQNCEMKTS